jgi:hypothetical protein
MPGTRVSSALKDLVNGSHSRLDSRPAPEHIPSIYEAIARDAGLHNLGLRTWVTIAAAVTFSLDSPDSAIELYKVATRQPGGEDDRYVAELVREVGFKCLSFNGIPRTINALNAFREKLPPHVVDQLWTRESRSVSDRNANVVLERGHSLWKSIYAPVDERLVAKLANAHPDLPGYIITNHYGALFSDPAEGRGSLVDTGQLLMSVIAVSCLRAQPGVAPQLLSHVRGLLKARGTMGLNGRNGVLDDVDSDSTDNEDGTTEQRGDVGDRDQDLRAAVFLTSEEGVAWVIDTVDNLVAALKGKLTSPDQFTKSTLSD